MNFSGVRLDMSFKEAKDLDALLARDKATPPRREIGGNGENVWTLYYCPSCGRIISDRDAFCNKCGQRIDTENAAL